MSKNSVQVYERNGKPNAYAGNNETYFKIGIYEWWWQTRPSDVTRRTLYFGDVTICGK